MISLYLMNRFVIEEEAMHVVHPPKKKTNVLTITVPARRGKAVYGKAGVHRDKRRVTKVNERVAWKRQIPS